MVQENENARYWFGFVAQSDEEPTLDKESEEEKDILDNESETEQKHLKYSKRRTRSQGRSCHL